MFSATLPANRVGSCGSQPAARAGRGDGQEAAAGEAAAGAAGPARSSTGPAVRRPAPRPAARPTARVRGASCADSAGGASCADGAGGTGGAGGAGVGPGRRSPAVPSVLEVAMRGAGGGPNPFGISGEGPAGGGTLAADLGQGPGWGVIEPVVGLVKPSRQDNSPASMTASTPYSRVKMISEARTSP